MAKKQEEFQLVNKGKIFMGLCTGLAESYGINVWLVRIGMILVTSFIPYGQFGYLLLPFLFSYKDVNKKDEMGVKLKGAGLFIITVVVIAFLGINAFIYYWGMSDSGAWG